MKPLKSLFLDTEFTGLHQTTTLISLAIVADTGEYFYAEFNDFDHSAITPWLQSQVLDNLLLSSGTTISLPPGGKTQQGTRSEIARSLKDWLAELFRKYGPGRFRFWADVPHYDWVLFCELFGGALHLPDYIHYMPMDVATLLYVRGIDPDTPRAELLNDSSLGGLRHHNALYDAFLIHRFLLTLNKE
ncbi:MAG: 3'-5' exoribonuclease [Leadbetterella sp.]|nr:3'-5' exoribonuclease [Leadbetterella sp.]